MKKKQLKKCKQKPLISKEDGLMYLNMEAKELQRELEHFEAKIDAIKLAAMDEIYMKK